MVSRAGGAGRPGEPPRLRRGVRWVDGTDLPGRTLLRPEFGDLVGADAADGGAGLAQAEGPALRASVGAVREAVRGGVAGGVWA